MKYYDGYTKTFQISTHFISLGFKENLIKIKNTNGRRI